MLACKQRTFKFKEPEIISSLWLDNSGEKYPSLLSSMARRTVLLSFLGWALPAWLCRSFLLPSGYLDIVPINIEDVSSSSSTWSRSQLIFHHAIFNVSPTMSIYGQWVQLNPSHGFPSQEFINYLEFLEYANIPLHPSTFWQLFHTKSQTFLSFEVHILSLQRQRTVEMLCCHFQVRARGRQISFA